MRTQTWLSDGMEYVQPVLLDIYRSGLRNGRRERKNGGSSAVRLRANPFEKLRSPLLILPISNGYFDIKPRATKIAFTSH